MPEPHGLVKAPADQRLTIGAEGDAPHVQGVTLQRSQRGPVARSPNPDDLVFSAARQSLAIGTEGDGPHGPGMPGECSSQSAVSQPPDPDSSVIAPARQPLPIPAEVNRCNPLGMIDGARELPIRDPPQLHGTVSAAGGKHASVGAESNFAQNGGMTAKAAMKTCLQGRLLSETPDRAQANNHHHPARTASHELHRISYAGFRPRFSASREIGRPNMIRCPSIVRIPNSRIPHGLS